MSIQATGPILDPERVRQSQCSGPGAPKQSLGRALAERLNGWLYQDAPQLVLNQNTALTNESISATVFHEMSLRLLRFCSVPAPAVLLVSLLWSCSGRAADP